MNNEQEEDYIAVLEQLHTNSVDIRNREIYLHGYIDENSAINFIKNINFLNNIDNKPILIYNQSMGGDISLGLSIYDAIKSSAAQTTIITCGIAASMGTIVAQAADLRLIFPSTVFLIHEGSISMEETETKTAVSTILSLKYYVEKFYDIYYSSCKNAVFYANMSEKSVKNYIRKTLQKKRDWYLTSDEIIKFGFADEILCKPISNTVQK